MASRRRGDGQGAVGGDLIGPNPTDRGKRGTKRSVIVEAAGGPLAVVIAGANVHDTKLLAATLEAIVVTRPEPTTEQPQHLCLDKGYDNPTGEAAVAADGYVPHIRRIGEEKLDAATGRSASGAPLGRRADAGVDEQVPCDPGAL